MLQIVGVITHQIKEKEVTYLSGKSEIIADGYSYVFHYIVTGQEPCKIETMLWEDFVRKYYSFFVADEIKVYILTPFKIRDVNFIPKEWWDEHLYADAFIDNRPALFREGDTSKIICIQNIIGSMIINHGIKDEKQQCKILSRLFYNYYSFYNIYILKHIWKNEYIKNAIMYFIEVINEYMVGSYRIKNIPQMFQLEFRLPAKDYIIGKTVCEISWEIYKDISESHLTEIKETIKKTFPDLKLTGKVKKTKIKNIEKVERTYTI
jgi:hypothetical protein